MGSLLIAVHGTRSATGQATLERLIFAVKRARPKVFVSVGYLDVQSPSLAASLTDLDGDVVVVPVLLSTGYHVRRDIPDVISKRADVRLARHSGPTRPWWPRCAID